MQTGENKSVAVGVLLFDRFSNHCLANAVEPLRAANGLLGYEAYQWQFLTIGGETVTSSSGLPIAGRDQLAHARGDVLFVLPSYGFRELANPGTARALRAASGRYGLVAGLDAGSWLLADAGLLAGHRATIHWEELEVFAEAFPEVAVERSRLVVDGKRWSCAGATTAFDLSLELIRRDHGALLALEVAAFLMHGAIGADALPDEVNMTRGEGVVTAAISIMRDNLEEPLVLGDLAARLAISLDRLKRAFALELGESPGTVYRRMRLATARRLVEQTRLSIAEIALRCGYLNASAMTRAFRENFGAAPSHFRLI